MSENVNNDDNSRVKKRGMGSYYTKLSLVIAFGWTFAGLLTGVISTICGAIAGERGYKSADLAGPYTALIASLLAVGVVYLVLAYQIKSPRYDAFRGGIATNVLSLVFLGGQVLPTIGYVVAFFMPLVGLILGFSGEELASIAQLVSAGLGILISLALIFYHVKTVVAIPRLVYVPVMAALVAVVVAMFAVFPAQLVRDAIDGRGNDPGDCYEYGYDNCLDY